VPPALRPELARLVQALLRRDERALSLNVVAETIGDAEVSYEDIDAIFRALEAAGRSIGDAEHPPASALLRQVLATARELSRELDRSPAPQDIAHRSGLSVEEVRLALLFARTLSR
jgi:hypothetical protein